jgi:hypothetical protein
MLELASYALQKIENYLKKRAKDFEAKAATIADDPASHVTNLCSVPFYRSGCHLRLRPLPKDPIKYGSGINMGKCYHFTLAERSEMHMQAQKAVQEIG